MADREFADFINTDTWQAFTERLAIMEIDGHLQHNTAIMEALKIHYPGEMASMLETCKELNLDREKEICQFIDTMQGREKEIIKATAEKLTMPKKASPVLQREGLPCLEYLIKKGIALIGVYDSKATINRGKEKGDPQEKAYTTDIETIKSLIAGNGDNQGRAKGTNIKRFSFIPKAAGLFCLDIDAKKGKENGIKELLKVFDPETLPEELKNIETFFPCYTKTPNNGYHLYFKYSGPPIKGGKLFPGIETKHDTLTAPGSVNAEGKPYILHGDIEAAPPLFGLILTKIKKQGLQKQETAPEKIAADKVTPGTAYKPQAWPQSKPRIDLDTLAAETSGGNHDRQVQFAGKVCRCQLAARNKGRDYSEFTLTAALAYVKANPVIFGSGADTENTIKSVFRDNGGM